MITFGLFTLDEESERLRYEDVDCPLRAKSLAVLRELTLRRGRLVTKSELFAACWPNTAVSQTVLRVCIAEVRAALSADRTGCTRVETVGRRGYRLVTDAGASHPTGDAPVGRERELAKLALALTRANAGLRQVVFVTGEAGLGKTTLVEQFVEATRSTSRTRVGWGQCVELTGAVEAYLPILDLLGRMRTEDAGGVVTAVLARCASGWLRQIRGAPEPRAATAAPGVPTASRERLLRELAEAFEALAADETLVLVLEDLHWSDLSSIDVLAYLAQRTQPARLLVVGTYRPADVALGEGPLIGIKQELVGRGRATEVALAPLSKRDVETYLSGRLSGFPIDDDVGRSLHARTKGNPLFLIATVDYLLGQGLLSAPGGRWRVTEPLDGIVPESVRQLAMRQVDRLDPLKRRVLDAACIVGSEFAVAAVGAASDLDAAAVEDVCRRLASQHELVRPTGVVTWPDGTMSSRYEFRHAVYREVVEGALPPVNVTALHRRVGERLEGAWGERSVAIASELAVHFAAAGDRARALRYHLAAASGASVRFAQREVALHMRAALEYMSDLPETAERARMELACVLDLGSALVATRGPASDEVLIVYRRALELADVLNLPEARFGAKTVIYTCAAMRAELDRARPIAEELLATAERLGNAWLKCAAHVSLGFTLFNLAEFASARLHLAEARALWRPEFPSAAFDPSVLARAMLGLVALICGEPDAGGEWVRDAVARAEEVGTPYNLSNANQLAAQYYATAGHRDRALEHAGTSAAVAAGYGFVAHEAVAGIVTGWARRDIDELRHGIARYEGTGHHVATSLFRALLIEILLETDHIAAARAELAIVFSFVQRSGERRHLPELHRLEGECIRRDAARGNGSVHDAAACFERAFTLAREQGARLWELRTAISAANLFASAGERGKARDLLTDHVGPFAGGDLPDLHRARDLIARL